MEFVGQLRPSEACNILEVPGLSSLDVDDDENEVVIGIRPKSSPLPRRKSSVTDDDSEPEPPLCSSRRVSFADSKGLSLVQVKEFETWDEPKLPVYEGEGKCTENYFLSLHTFSLPLSTEELFIKVQDQKVELETIKLLPGTTILKGVIRVLNISFSKAVYVRTTLDGWCSHFDLLAEYIPGSSDGLMDSFSFKLTLVPPFGEQGARVDFCLRYETPLGTFWANNNNRNYVLFCHHGMKDQKEKPQKESLNKKSCLKPVSQNPTVENVSAVEASSQEKISTVVSTQGEEVNTVKNKQMSDNQARTSEEGEQKLQDENRRNRSQRSRRRATQMARLRDYFAQRDGEADDTRRYESPPEAKQAAKEENLLEKHTEMQSCSEAGRMSEVSQFVSETEKTCTKPLTDTLNDTLQAHNYTSNSEPEESESNNLADSVTLTGGKAIDISDNPLHSNKESAESQNINKSISKADGKSLKQGTSDECTNNNASEPADSVISTVSESLVSQANSFTFGTVVAPLYRQVFGRMGRENQSEDDRGNPVWATPNARDLTQSFYHTERRENSSTVATDARGNNDRVQENEIKTQDSNRESSDAATNIHPVVEEKEDEEEEEEKEEETSLNVMENDTLDHGDNLQDPVEILHSEQSYTKTFEPVSGDTESHPHTGNILNMDLGNALIPEESLYPHGEAQEDSLSFDIQSQAIAETTHAQLPEHKYSQVKMNPDETHAQIQTQEAIASVETYLNTQECVNDETDKHTSISGEHVFISVDEANTDNEVGKTVTMLPTSVISVEDKLKEAVHEMNPNPSDNSVTKETANSYISCYEIGEEDDFKTHKTSLEIQEETDDVEKRNKLKNNLYGDETKHSDIEVGDELAESMTTANHTCGDTGDMFVELRDEQPIIVSEKEEHYEMGATVSRGEDFSFAEPTKVKNWEIKVEKEEKNILTDEDESKAIYLKDTEAEGDQRKQLWDTGIETVSENKDTKERGKEKPDEAWAEEITDLGEKENNTEDANVSGVKHSIGEGKIGHIMAGKNRDVEKKFEYVETTQMEMIAGEDEPVEEPEVEKREEQEEKEKHFTEKHDVNTEMTNVPKKEDMEAEEKMKIDHDDKEGVVWENQEENVKEEKWDYKEETLVETGEAEIVDADSEGVTLEGTEDEVACFEDRLDITQNKLEDGLSALVNTLQDKDKENTGEGQLAHMPAEMHFYKEEDFQSNQKVTHDRSNAKDTAERCLCILTDEPESDQTSHSSASAESDSDDEVELYMHCLRAIHTGTQANKDRNKDAASTISKRPSVSRSKHVSAPMPSISESLDEEPHLSCLQGNNEDMERTDIQPTGTALSGGQDRITRNVARWKKTFSCSNISKTLLYATLLVIFLVVAYHYDFLACFGLYLVSVIWLCCQGETQPVKSNNRIG